MGAREPHTIRKLLTRFLAARARRDRADLESDAWHAADAEMHAIERSIFRLPVEDPEDPSFRARRRIRPPRYRTRLRNALAR